jgi:mannose-6-phosphate isomerase
LYPISPSFKHYHWGSKQKLQTFFGTPVNGEPLAEVWFGTHRTSGSDVTLSPKKTIQLQDYIVGNVDKHLGKTVQKAYGKELPFLIKLLAVRSALSIQVHPDSTQARAGFAREEAQKIRVANPLRSFKDPNPKPELFVALQVSYMFNGFLPGEEILANLDELEGPLVDQIRSILSKNSNPDGVKAAFELILDTRKDSETKTGLNKTLTMIQDRADNSFSLNELQDKLLLLVAQDCPGDASVLALLLMNPMELNVFDSAYIPEGRVHQFVRGFGVELMINSDNVLRAGLTKKHINREAFMEAAVFSPSGRLAANRSLTEGNLYDYRTSNQKSLGINLGCLSESGEIIPVYPEGPRIIICLKGEIELRDAKDTLKLTQSQAAFISDIDAEVEVSGLGEFVMGYVSV